MAYRVFCRTIQEVVWLCTWTS